MRKRKLKAELEAMRLPELQAKFAEVTGEESRAPNRKFLIRKITEALEAGGEVGTPVDDAGKKAKAPKKAAPAKAPPEAEASDQTASDEAEVKLSKLDVPALQARIHELTGRETSSTNRRYLIWRAQQAAKGRIPLGPRARRGNAGPAKVLPMRVPAAAVQPLAEAKERLGLRSRNDLFLKAVHDFLANAGEAEVAALFAPNA